MQQQHQHQHISDNFEYTVIKRNGVRENISFDKILKRIKLLANSTNNINLTNLAIKVIHQLHDGIKTTQIDELTAQQCDTLSSIHPDYGILASKIIISNHHKNTPSTFAKAMKQLYKFVDSDGKHCPLISVELYQLSQKYSKEIEERINYENDNLFDYFGFKTLERSYLLKIGENVVERPQHMWMRVSLGIHGQDLNKAFETYEYMSNKYFTHATPTLFNAGTQYPQNSSCYLVAMESDSIDGIYKTLGECAGISKWAGGIGLHIHNIRSKGAHIRGTNGNSNGIIPMLRVFNETARYVDQGGGKRKGSIAIYIEPWHLDIFEFLDLKKNTGNEEMRCRDLFTALWIPNLFMERVKTNDKWTLFCPDICKKLPDVYGDKFKELYEKYEQEISPSKKKVVNARDVWFKIIDSQIETGGPYMLYKDACNAKSNQQNIGVIKSSNLCTEIVQYSSPKETAVCNLASIALSKFVKRQKHEYKSVVIYTKTECAYCKLAKKLLKDVGIINIKEVNLDNDVERSIFYSNISEKENKQISSVPQIYLDDKYVGGYTELKEIFKMVFDYQQLHDITSIVTENLNKIIDINFYPNDKTKRSNLLHRPIGIGVQGLADVFCMMDLPFDCEESKKINKNIFETIYHASVEKSMLLSKQRGETIMKYVKSNFVESVGLDEQFPKDFIKENNIAEDDISGEKVKSNNIACGDSKNQVKSNNHVKYKAKSKEFVQFIFANQELNISEMMENKPHLLSEIQQINLAEAKNLTFGHIGAYSSFEGSPASKGILQFDMWNVTPSSGMYDWAKLKADVMKHGMRNSLLVAPMPTASTSQILGNNECIEPFTANIYVRRTLAGEYMIINKYMVEDFMCLGIWNEQTKNKIIADKGSIQYLEGVPKHIKNKYKIVWEISMKHLIDMAKDRGAYICQSQSLNLWQEDPTMVKLTKMHMYAYDAGLKTGIYYLRRKPKHNPQQFTIEPEKKTLSTSLSVNSLSSMSSYNSNMGVNEEEGECLMCSS